MADAAPLVAVVDDDGHVLTSLGTLLASAGYDVRLFASGAEFFASGCVTRIDCLISDIAMPEMGGFDVVRLAREACPSLPVMLMSGRCDAEGALPPVDLARFAFFSKPFDPQALLAAVGHAVRRAKDPLTRT